MNRAQANLTDVALVRSRSSEARDRERLPIPAYGAAFGAGAGGVPGLGFEFATGSVRPTREHTQVANEHTVL